VPESQFGAPRGVRGWLAAQLVSRLTADANRWMIKCLEVETNDRVLDVGCGPGLGVAFAAGTASAGFVAGVDASPTMVRQALGRNRAAVRDGRVGVVRADAAHLPFGDGCFDKVCSLNSMQFWPSPEVGLREMHRVGGPRGRVVLALMARSDDPPADAPPAWLAPIARLMEDSGSNSVGLDRQTFGGVVHWALLGAPATTCGDGLRGD